MPDLKKIVIVTNPFTESNGGKDAAVAFAQKQLKHNQRDPYPLYVFERTSGFVVVRDYVNGQDDGLSEKFVGIVTAAEMEEVKFYGRIVDHA